MMITPKSVAFVDASPAFSHNFSMIFTMRCGSRALKQRRHVSLELSGGWKAPRGMADAVWSDLHLHMKEHIDKCYRMCLNRLNQLDLLTPPLAKDCLTSKSNRNLKEVLSLQSAGAEKRKDTRVSVFEDQDGECQK
jgi:hypothetical protein